MGEMKHRDEKWLRTQYLVERTDVKDMADEANVGVATIYNWLDKYDIERRSRGPTPEAEYYRDEAWLRAQYHDQEKSVREIAAICDVTQSTISRWLNKLDIKTRKPGFAEGAPNPMQRDEVVEKHGVCGKRGEDHPSYKGGDRGKWRNKQPWLGLREAVIERDGEECSVCGETRSEHRDRQDEDLHVHHIVPTSQGGAKYDADNLQALCRECHEQKHREL